MDTKKDVLYLLLYYLNLDDNLLEFFLQIYCDHLINWFAIFLKNFGIIF